MCATSLSRTRAELEAEVLALRHPARSTQQTLVGAAEPTPLTLTGGVRPFFRQPLRDRFSAAIRGSVGSWQAGVWPAPWMAVVFAWDQVMPVRSRDHGQFPRIWSCNRSQIPQGPLSLAIRRLSLSPNALSGHVALFFSFQLPTRVNVRTASAIFSWRIRRRAANFKKGRPANTQRVALWVVRRLRIGERNFGSGSTDSWDATGSEPEADAPSRTDPSWTSRSNLSVRSPDRGRDSRFASGRRGTRGPDYHRSNIRSEMGRR